MRLWLRPGWYILLYHDISWEESVFVRHIGGTCAPDIFRAHVALCKSLGRIVSVEDGMAALERGKLDEALFSFWFDDGFLGVRKYAADILANSGITAATSICSRFVSRSEFFWRAKLSYLFSKIGSTNLRCCLGMGKKDSECLIRNYTKKRFNDTLIKIINGLFDELAGAEVQENAFNIFDNEQGISKLCSDGWVLANHSASHYPIKLRNDRAGSVGDFKECDEFIEDRFGVRSKFWVVPFGEIDLQDLNAIREIAPDKMVVMVGDRINTPFTLALDGVIYRINVPVSSKHKLINILFRCH
jgi:peptidoglycan/xylan/chitin deacetylase (PgdA/CDA1 family)